MPIRFRLSARVVGILWRCSIKKLNGMTAKNGSELLGQEPSPNLLLCRAKVRARFPK